MRVKMKEHINLLRTGLMVFCFSFILSTAGCKTQNIEKSVPFSIEEKAYYYWVGGRQGTRGTTIRLEGSMSSLNISFSKLYFQQREYEVVPEFKSDYFIIEGVFSEFSDADKQMTGDSYGEYGNKAPQSATDFPFDLKDNEAVLLYSINGREGFYKISDIKQLDKVFRP